MYVLTNCFRSSLAGKLFRKYQEEEDDDDEDDGGGCDGRLQSHSDSMAKEDDACSERHCVSQAPTNDESEAQSTPDDHDPRRPLSAETSCSKTSESGRINELTRVPSKAPSQPVPSTSFLHAQFSLPKPLPKPSRKRPVPEYWPRPHISLSGFKRQKRQLGGDLRTPAFLPPATPSIITSNYFSDAAEGVEAEQAVVSPSALDCQSCLRNDQVNTHDTISCQSEQVQETYDTILSGEAEPEPGLGKPDIELTDDDVQTALAPLPDTDSLVRHSTPADVLSEHNHHDLQDMPQELCLAELQNVRPSGDCFFVESRSCPAPVLGMGVSQEQPPNRTQPVVLTQPNSHTQARQTIPDETYCSRMNDMTAVNIDEDKFPRHSKKPQSPVLTHPAQTTSAACEQSNTLPMASPMASQSRAHAAATLCKTMPAKARPDELKKLVKFVQGLGNDHNGFRNMLHNIERLLERLVTSEPQVVQEVPEPGTSRLLEQLMEEFRQFKAGATSQLVPDSEKDGTNSVMTTVGCLTGLETLHKDIETLIDTRVYSMRVTIGGDLQDGMKRISSRLDEVIEQLKSVRPPGSHQPCQQASIANVLSQSNLESASTRIHDMCEALKGHASTLQSAIPSASVMKELNDLLRAQVVAQQQRNQGVDPCIREEITKKEQEVEGLQRKLAMLAKTQEELRTQSALQLEQGFEKERTNLLAMAEASSKQLFVDHESRLFELANVTEERNRLRKDVDLHNQRLNDTCVQLEQLRARSTEHDASEERLQAMTQQFHRLQEKLSNYEANRGEDAERISELQGLLDRTFESHAARKRHMESAFEEHAQRNEQQIENLQEQVAEQQKELEKLQGRLDRPLPKLGEDDQSIQSVNGEDAQKTMSEAIQEHTRERRRANRQYHGMTQMTSPGPRCDLRNPSDGLLRCVQTVTLVHTDGPPTSAAFIENSPHSAIITPRAIQIPKESDCRDHHTPRNSSFVVPSSQNIIQATPSVKQLDNHYPYTPHKPKTAKELETTVRDRHASQTTPSRCSQGHIPNSSTKRIPIGSRPYTPGSISNSHLSKAGPGSPSDPLHGRVSKCILQHGSPKSSIVGRVSSARGELDCATLGPNTPKEASQATGNQPAAQKFTVSDLPSGIANSKNKSKSQSQTGERSGRSVTFGKVTQSQ